MATVSATGSRVRRRLLRAIGGDEASERVAVLEARLDSTAASLAELSRSLDELRATVQDLDPEMWRDMLTSVRDDVARTAEALAAQATQPEA